MIFLSWLLFGWLMFGYGYAVCRWVLKPLADRHDNDDFLIIMWV